MTIELRRLAGVEGRDRVLHGLYLLVVGHIDELPHPLHQERAVPVARGGVRDGILPDMFGVIELGREEVGHGLFDVVPHFDGRDCQRSREGVNEDLLADDGRMRYRRRCCPRRPGRRSRTQIAYIQRNMIGRPSFPIHTKKRSPRP